MRPTGSVHAADESGARVDFPPLRNGIDYLVSVVTALNHGEEGVDPRKLKYAVLHLQAATELDL